MGTLEGAEKGGYVTHGGGVVGLSGVDADVLVGSEGGHPAGSGAKAGVAGGEGEGTVGWRAGAGVGGVGGVGVGVGIGPVRAGMVAWVVW